MKRAAIITARGGSKRIPRKNIRHFHGRPIVHYPIAVARESGLFDEIIISTEDEEIATIAHLAGCQVVIKRPPELADDHATTAQVMRHAVEHLSSGGHQLEQVCCIYPCTPLMSASDLHRGLAALNTGKCYAIPVAKFAPAVQRAIVLDERGTITPAWAQNTTRKTRTQDLEPHWYDPGQWYWGSASAWLNEIPIYGSWSVGVPIERRRAIDIDEPEDWLMAEAIYQQLQDEKRRPQP